MFNEEYAKFRASMKCFFRHFLVEFEVIFKIISVLLFHTHFSLALVWAEQGDEISLEYAGTHALKGDLVR